MNIAKEMCNRKLSLSMGEARRLISGNHVTVNDVTVTDANKDVSKSDSVKVIRKGNKG